MAGTTAADPALLERIAAALERLAPPPAATVDLSAAEAFVWEARGERLRPVPRVAGVPYDLLVGIERVALTLHRQHAAVRRGPAGQQRAALGHARHGQELARQGDPRPR